MTKKSTSIFRATALALAISTASISMLPATASAASASAVYQVRFAKGATSKDYAGVLRGYNWHTYRFTAKAGQTLNVDLGNSDPGVDVVVKAVGKDDELVADNQVLPYNGQYEVRVLLTRNDARKGINRRYNLNIAITNDGAAMADGSLPSATATGGWRNYKCDNGKTLQVMHHFGEATATAQVKADGKTYKLNYSDESTADTAVFTGDGGKWTADQNRANLPKSGFFFLVKGGADEIVGKNCELMR